MGELGLGNARVASADRPFPLTYALCGAIEPGAHRIAVQGVDLADERMKTTNGRLRRLTYRRVVDSGLHLAFHATADRPKSVVISGRIFGDWTTLHREDREHAERYVWTSLCKEAKAHGDADVFVFFGTPPPDPTSLPANLSHPPHPMPTQLPFVYIRLGLKDYTDAPDQDPSNWIGTDLNRCLCVEVTGERDDTGEFERLVTPLGNIIPSLKAAWPSPPKRTPTRVHWGAPQVKEIY
jgi:hypothetical protein